MDSNSAPPAITILPPPAEDPLLVDGRASVQAQIKLGQGSGFEHIYQQSPQLFADASSPYNGMGLSDSPAGQTPQLSLAIESDHALRNATAGEAFLNVDHKWSLDDRSGSPIDPWSPASTSSGDNFPEHFSDSSWSPSGSASPSYSHPSSPLVGFSLNELNLSNDVFTDDDNASAIRRASFSEGSDYGDAFGRPRSGSFDNQLFAPSPMDDFTESITMSVAPPSPYQAPVDWNNDTFNRGLNMDPFFPLDLTQPIPPSQSRHRSSSVSSLRSPTSNVGQPHGNYLTVPEATPLQRRNATSHRRNQSHTGIHSHMDGPLEGNGRGRPLSLQPSHQHTRHRSLPGRPPSPQIQTDFTDFTALQTDFGSFPPPPSFSSPSTLHSSSSDYSGYPDSGSFVASPYHSPHSPHSPSHSLSDIPDISVFEAGSSSQPLTRTSPIPSDRALARSISDPYPTALKRRGSRSRRSAGSDNMGVFKQDGNDTEPEEPETPGDYKETVGSDKIVAASNKRRLNPARFKCDKCDSTFTARHNLTNHMNSHLNRKKFACQYCGQRSVTQAVLTRHQMKSCKQKPGSKKGGLNYSRTV